MRHNLFRVLFTIAIFLPSIVFGEQPASQQLAKAVEELNALKPEKIELSPILIEDEHIKIEGYAAATQFIPRYLHSIEDQKIGVVQIREITSIKRNGGRSIHFILSVTPPAPEKAATATSASTPSDAYPALPNWATDSLEMVVAKDAKSHRRLILHFNPTPDIHDVGDAGGWFMVVDESGKQLISKMLFPSIHYYSVSQPNADEFEKERKESHERPSGGFPYFLTNNGKYGFILTGKTSGCLDTVLFFNADNGYIHNYEFPPKCDAKDERLPGYAFVTEDGLALLAEASESTCMMSGVICEPKFIYGFNLRTRTRLMPKQFPKYRSLDCNCGAY